MNKIKRVSLFFRILFQVLFIIVPIFLVLEWINVPKPLSMLGGGFIFDLPYNYPVLHPLTLNQKIIGFFVSTIPMAVTLFVLYYLIKLFCLYEQGEIFSIKNVHYIRKVGFTLLIGQLINPIHDVLMSINLTWHVHPHVAEISVTGTNIGILLTALMVILISWIMAEGYKLREEQQLTV